MVNGRPFYDSDGLSYYLLLATQDDSEDIRTFVKDFIRVLRNGDENVRKNTSLPC